MTSAIGNAPVWIAALLTVAILAAYEMALLLLQYLHPERLARSVHASLREDWLQAMAQQRGSEILAIQTLRNALMAATMVASTAVLGLMGTVTLAAPTMHATLDEGASLSTYSGTRLALVLVLMSILFAALVCSVMAVRYYNHVGFIGGMPVDSPQRQIWSASGTLYLRRAGMLYSWGLRHLLTVAPILVSILYPWAGPVAAGLVVLALLAFDRVPASQGIYLPAASQFR